MTSSNREAQDDASLIAVLEGIQARYRYLPFEALVLASERLGVPLSQAFSVATFYHAFSLRPKGKHCLHVCMGTACHVRGSRRYSTACRPSWASSLAAPRTIESTRSKRSTAWARARSARSS